MESNTQKPFSFHIARHISVLCAPYLIPTVAFLALFAFSYLRIMPLRFKLIVTGMVFCFTVILPFIAIYLSRYIFARTDVHAERRSRLLAYFFCLTSYLACFIIMSRLNIPWYMSGIVLAYLVTMVIMLVAHLKWKWCEHSAGMGLLIGGLVSYSALFAYNPVFWLCILILLAGVVGSARIILGQHSFGDVLAGFVVGLISALLVLHPVSNFFFRVLF